MSDRNSDGDWTTRKQDGKYTSSTQEPKGQYDATKIERGVGERKTNFF